MLYMEMAQKMPKLVVVYRKRIRNEKQLETLLQLTAPPNKSYSSPFLFLNEASGLMRSACCVCVCRTCELAMHGMTLEITPIPYFTI
jgi:hypothetical protein